MSVYVWLGSRKEGVRPALVPTLELLSQHYTGTHTPVRVCGQGGGGTLEGVFSTVTALFPTATMKAVIVASPWDHLLTSVHTYMKIHYIVLNQAWYDSSSRLPSSPSPLPPHCPPEPMRLRCAYETQITHRGGPCDYPAARLLKTNLPLIRCWHKVISSWLKHFFSLHAIRWHSLSPGQE